MTNMAMAHKFNFWPDLGSGLYEQFLEGAAKLIQRTLAAADVRQGAPMLSRPTATKW
jgi:hypothetical protein